MHTYDLLTTVKPTQRAAQGSPAGATMARLWELRGIPVIEQDGVYWTRYRGPIYASFPCTVGLAPEPGEMEALLRKMRIAGVRVPSNGRGLACGLHVVIPKEYDLEKLSRQTRSRVKRGLERCEIRPVDPEELRAEGLALNRQTLERQHRQDPEFTDPQRWSKFVRALRDCPGCMTTGAYVNGRLAAYLVSCRDGDWIRLLYKMSRTEDLELRTNYALDYWAIAEAAQDPAIRGVENGFSSLNGDSGVDEYKRHMGYVAFPTKLSIYFHPAIAPWAASRPVVSAARALSSAYPRYGLPLMTRVLEAAVETKLHEAQKLGVPASGCQQEESTAYSRLFRPYAAILVSRLSNSLRKEGIGAALRKTARFVSRSLRRNRRASAPPRAPIPDAVLGLQPGEWVEVKSEAEILATLDSKKKCRGLLFTDDMRPSYGRRFRVLKRVQQIYLEEARQSRKVRDTVILEGAHCPGTGFECDRYCYLLWREAWLRRVDSANPVTEGSRQAADARSQEPEGRMALVRID